MPTTMIKNFSKRSKKSIKEVERLWEEAKDEIKKQMKVSDERYWPYVTNRLKSKLGLEEFVLFKEW